MRAERAGGRDVSGVGRMRRRSQVRDRSGSAESRVGVMIQRTTRAVVRGGAGRAAAERAARKSGRGVLRERRWRVQSGILSVFFRRLSRFFGRVEAVVKCPSEVSEIEMSRGRHGRGVFCSMTTMECGDATRGRGLRRQTEV